MAWFLSASLMVISDFLCLLQGENLGVGGVASSKQQPGLCCMFSLVPADIL